nr:4,5-DOPA dioxygenase extradiol [uncultured Steroidobacter sp.]
MSASQRLPVIFFGHGNPMNALADNVYTRGWRRIGESFPKPRAILCVSAHWYVPYTAVTAMQSPRTIHDFGGFPRELFEFQYPAPGDPGIAAEVVELLGPTVALDDSWGLDHGAWSVLCHCYPDADVPVVQLSIDETLTAQDHYRIGRSLAPLRERGILIVGSGNLVHNLHTYGWGRRVIDPYDWAVRFEQRARAFMLAGDHEPLINYEQLGKDATLSVPTPDHYLPLLYVLGAQLPGDKVTFPIEGVDGGSISMLSVQLG